MFIALDMPESVRRFLTAAVKNNTIDASDIWSLALRHRNDWNAIRNQVMGYAFNNRHHLSGQQAHAELCDLNDRCAREVSRG